MKSFFLTVVSIGFILSVSTAQITEKQYASNLYGKWHQLRFKEDSTIIFDFKDSTYMINRKFSLVKYKFKDTLTKSDSLQVLNELWLTMDKLIQNGIEFKRDDSVNIFSRDNLLLGKFVYDKKKRKLTYQIEEGTPTVSELFFPERNIMRLTQNVGSRKWELTYYRKE